MRPTCDFLPALDVGDPRECRGYVATRPLFWATFDCFPRAKVGQGLCVAHVVQAGRGDVPLWALVGDHHLGLL